MTWPHRFERHFVLHGHFGPAITSNWGMPEGCGLSVVAMSLIDWCWDVYQSVFAPATVGLLDGGATNALRQGTADEIKAAVPVDVELAAGTAKLFQSVETGTLLSVERVEPIVPLRGLVSLGYKIRWDDRGCLIFHPQVGRIRCWLRNGCPVVVESHALSLIRDIEEHEKFKRLGPKLAVGKVSDAVKDWWNKRYPEVPDKVLDFMVGQEAPPQDGSGLPWNRRFRKRVERAKAVVIHLFSGSEEDSKLWGKGWPPHVEVITVDIRQNSAMDLHLKDVWGYLCHVARTKRILAIIGGPPCRTVSRLRLIQPGPRPYCETGSRVVSVWKDLPRQKNLRSMVILPCC